MGQKYEWQSLDNVETTAAALQEAASHLVAVALAMRENAMQQALFPWTQRQWDCLDVIITLGSQCESVIPSQVTAKRQNRPSQYEIAKKRSAITVAGRKARGAAPAETTPETTPETKKRGRPTKSAAAKKKKGST